MNLRSKLQEDELDEYMVRIRHTMMNRDLSDDIMAKVHREQRIESPRRLKNYFKFLRPMIPLTIIAALLILIGSIVVSPAMAQSLQQAPFIRSIFEFAGDLGLNVAHKQDLTIHPAVSATQDDTTLTIPEIIYDGTRVSFSLEQTNPSLTDIKEMRELQDDIQHMDVQINGKDVDQYAPRYSNIPIITKPGVDDDSVIVELMTMQNRGGKPFPSSFEMTVTIQMAQFKEPFLFTVPVSVSTGEKAALLTNEQSKAYKIFTITLEKLELTPITTSLIVRQSFPGGTSYDFLTTGLDYEVWDEKGNELSQINGSGGQLSDEGDFIYDLRFEPFPSKPEKIIIKPYLPQYSKVEKGAYLYDQDGEIVKEMIPELEFEIRVD
ncbi:DUF4179 domain-containing protein [Paenibacillus sp. Marseille-Q4541]|uniref:DUF4179 domain-containing protein n=1 Tax=Paenibacillus sp. Marseille-Q4541 TaxID=2831522 RepID=UPI001BA73606|nr:DUF4179 domain-containing protein [Paenibacillus sp. Marseille-Q4541]